MSNPYQSFDQLSNYDLISGRKDQWNFQKWLLDDIEEVSLLQNSLRGVMINPDSGKYDEVSETRLMNDRGARILTETFILPLIKNAKLTQLEPEDKNRKMFGIMKMLNFYLVEKQEEYEIDYGNIALIISLIQNFLEDVYARSLYGAEQERLGTTQKVISKEEISNRDYGHPQMSQDDKKLFDLSKWKPW